MFHCKLVLVPIKVCKECRVVCSRAFLHSLLLFNLPHLSNMAVLFEYSSHRLVCTIRLSTRKHLDMVRRVTGDLEKDWWHVLCRIGHNSNSIVARSVCISQYGKRDSALGLNSVPVTSSVESPNKGCIMGKETVLWGRMVCQLQASDSPVEPPDEGCIMGNKTVQDGMVCRLQASDSPVEPRDKGP